MNKSQRALLFVNGQIHDLDSLQKILEPDDLLVAVDGGLRHLKQLGNQPHVLIVDLDSVRAADVANLEKQGARVIRYPPVKDETDLELAIQFVINLDCQSIRIVGALGGRVDHLLGNIFTLLDPNQDDRDVRLDDGTTEIFLIHRQAEVIGEKGDLVSLIPIQGEARGIKTTGLRYPLVDETLLPHKSRGISNIMLKDRAIVEVKDGLLLCIHTRRR